LNRITNSEEDVKELEEALQNGIQVLCKILSSYLLEEANEAIQGAVFEVNNQGG
jgi:hypothetical protein